MSNLGKAIGVIGAIAIIATIAAKPGFIAPTFAGTAKVIKAAKGL